MESVAALLENSVKVCERHYPPWMKVRQDRLEEAVRAARLAVLSLREDVVTFGRNKLARCIYTQPSGLCSGNAGFDGEHWFSRGLGNFRGFQELEEKICKDCNNLFGRKLEDVFLHSGPEALFREIAGGNLGRKSHEKHNIFARGAHKHPPVQVMGEDPDAKRSIMWEVGPSSESKPQRQVVLVGPRGEIETIRLGPTPCAFDAWLPDVLKERRDAGFKAERFFGDSQEDLRQIDALCSEIFGNHTVQFETGEGGQVIQAYSAFLLSPMYFRAVAKIGLHAFLFFYPHITGFEPEFDAIKRFIYKGEEPNRYVYGSSEPIIDTADLAAPAHAIACDWNQHSLETRIQFFAGLEGAMRVVVGAQGGAQIAARQGELVYVVTLGSNPSRLVFEDRRGSVFRYFKEPEDGHHGEVVELRGSGKALPIALLLKL